MAFSAAMQSIRRTRAASWQKRYRVQATRTSTRTLWTDGNRAISELAKLAMMAKVESLRTSKRAQTRHQTRASQRAATDSNNLR